MSILSRADFAATCTTDVKKLNVYVSRNKVAVHGDKGKLIDTENPLNKIFKKNCLKLEKEKTIQQKEKKLKPAAAAKLEKIYNEVVEVFKPEEKIYTKPESEEQKAKREKQNDDDETEYEWDLRKKIADAKRSEMLAEKAQLEVEKMMGNLMPVDLVQRIITVNIKDIFKTFENDLENLASIYCDTLAGGDRTKLAAVMLKIREKLTSNIKRIKETSAKEIETVVDEYSETRNRGERNQ